MNRFEISWSLASRPPIIRLRWRGAHDRHPVDRPRRPDRAPRGRGFFCPRWGGEARPHPVFELSRGSPMRRTKMREIAGSATGRLARPLAMALALWSLAALPARAEFIVGLTTD